MNGQGKDYSDFKEEQGEGNLKDWMKRFLIEKVRVKDREEFYRSRSRKGGSK